MTNMTTSTCRAAKQSASCCAQRPWGCPSRKPSSPLPRPLVHLQEADDTYIPPSLPTYLTTYLPTYIHTYTYIPTYLHTYIHTYIRSSEAPKQDTAVGSTKHTMRTMRTIGLLASQRPLVIPRRQRSSLGMHYPRLSNLRLCRLERCICICIHVYVYMYMYTCICICIYVYV
jgi:hypothetical protein